MISIIIEIIARIGVISFNLSLLLLIILLIYLTVRVLAAYFIHNNYYVMHPKLYLGGKLLIIGLMNSLILMLAAVILMYFTGIIPDIVNKWDDIDNLFFIDRQFHMFLSALKDWNYE